MAGNLVVWLGQKLEEDLAQGALEELLRLEDGKSQHIGHEFTAGLSMVLTDLQWMEHPHPPPQTITGFLTGCQFFITSRAVQYWQCCLLKIWSCTNSSL